MCILSFSSRFHTHLWDTPPDHCRLQRRRFVLAKIHRRLSAWYPCGLRPKVVGLATAFEVILVTVYYGVLRYPVQPNPFLCWRGVILVYCFVALNFAVIVLAIPEMRKPREYVTAAIALVAQVTVTLIPAGRMLNKATQEFAPPVSPV